MSLEKITYHSLDYIPSALVKYIEKLTKKHRMIEVVLPSTGHVGRAQKALATTQSACSGVLVQAFPQYVASLWSLVTDGRKIAQKSQIEVMAANFLRDDVKDLGKASAIAEILFRAACGLEDKLPSIQDKNCKDIVKKAQSLLDLLHKTGYITQKEAMDLIGETEIDLSPVIFSGFEQGDINFVDFIEGLAKKTSIFYVIPETEAGKILADALPGKTQELTTQEDRGGAELEMLRSAVFSESTEVLDSPLASENAQLIFLEPLGPSAEAESIARLVEQCENAEEALLVTTNPEKMWRSVAPKLASTMTVHASWSKPLLSVKPVSLFLNFVGQLWTLLDDRKEWEAFADKWNYLAEATLVSSEEMQEISQDYAELPDSWWPPKAIVDFLHSSCSPFGPANAKDIDNFDVFIRSHRDITPDILLKRLGAIATEKTSKSEDAQILFNAIKQHVMNYDLKGAIEAVLQVSFDDYSQETQRAMTKLYSLLLEIEAGQKNECIGKSKKDKVEAAKEQLEIVTSLAKTKTMNYAFQANDIKGYKRFSLDIISYSDAASIRPRSYSLCVLADQSMEAQAARMYSTSVERLIADNLGNKKIVPEDMEVQAKNFKLLAIGREQVAFEKPQFSSEGRAVFPSPLLSAVESHYDQKALKRYKTELKELLGSFLQQSEEKVRQNYSSHREEQEPKKYAREKEITLSGRAKEIIGYAVEKDEVEDKHVLSSNIRLSPTSLEELRACPRRWFFTRGLPTKEQDAVFAATSKGTLYHDVLKRFLQQENTDKKRLDKIWNLNFARALAQAGGVDLKLSQETKKELLPFFNSVPKRLQEVQDVNDMAQNLERLVKSGTVFIDGFKPVLYEYEFEPDIATYASAGQKGSIDRIDIDANGNILIIDYKSSKEAKLKEYVVSSKKKVIIHPQTFMYARIIENLMQQIKKDVKDLATTTELKIIGVLYLGVADYQAYFGYVSSEELAENLKKSVQGSKVSVDIAFESLVDEIEDEMTSLVQNELSQGLLFARPLDGDKSVCKYCDFKYKCSVDMRRVRAEVEKRELWSKVCQK